MVARVASNQLMGDNYPLTVSCWGRTYQVSTDDEKAELLGYLETDQKALANRYRVAEGPSRWPQRRRQPPNRLRIPLRCGGFFEIVSSFSIADLGSDERSFVSAIADAIQ